MAGAFGNVKGEKKMKRYPSFVIRTVHHSCIKFDGILWKPKEAPVPSDRLDGKRFLFGVYPKYIARNERLDILFLWGTEKCSKALQKSEEAYKQACEDDIPILSPDGYLRQELWVPV